MVRRQERGGGTNNTETTEEKLEQKDQIKCNVTRQILGAQGEISEVGIPLPHNSDNTHALVSGNNNNNNNMMKYGMQEIPTVTLSTTLLKPTGQANLYVWFVYVPHTVWNNAQRQISGSMRADKTNYTVLQQNRILKIPGLGIGSISKELFLIGY